MKILIFSWRDIKNPKSGGAEILTQELAKRWINKGHQVSLVSTRFPGSKPQEIIEGIKIFRPAKFYQYSLFQYLFYLIKTTKFYKKNLAGKYDLIIDQVHGLPFFTPFYVKEKVILFPLEVAKEIWHYEISFPFSIVGIILEILYIKLFKNFPFLVISPSTAKDLKQMGVKKTFIITPGISFKPQKRVPKKSPVPALVVLGRITKMKRIEHVLKTLQLLTKDFPKIKLFIIGRGERKYIQNLKNLSHKMGTGQKVFFSGFVSEEEKQSLLSRAWALISTSVREGWGLVAVEAAACGTPAVVYNVPGLRDCVKNKKTGLICPENSPYELAKEVKKVLTDNAFRKNLSQNALNYSRNFSWDKTANEALTIFKKIVSQ